MNLNTRSLILNKIYKLKLGGKRNLKNACSGYLHYYLVFIDEALKKVDLTLLTKVASPQKITCCFFGSLELILSKKKNDRNILFIIIFSTHRSSRIPFCLNRSICPTTSNSSKFDDKGTPFK